jgi:branched-chain amino acid transport system permease protein
MRFIFKTSYDQDIRISKHSGHLFWYSSLLVSLIFAPSVLPAYWSSLLTMAMIYSIVGLGLMLLSGFTGLFSIGHAAFMGVGAYTQAVLTSMGWPFPVAIVCSMALSAAVGAVVGLPALRVRGIYLAIATLAFAFIVQEVFTRWESVTGGNRGLTVGMINLFGWKTSSPIVFYYICLVLTILTTLGMLNLLRSATGRAFVAIRDSEISAQSMGVNLARYKTLSFAVSAALAGLGGALSAHMLRFISPDQFGIVQSIDLLLIVIIGGLGSVHGAFFGAIFLIASPQAISFAKNFLPSAIGETVGLQSLVYGLVLIAFVLYEPMGIYGRWVKIRTWFELAPLYRKGLFKRQKNFQKTERLK